MPLSVLELRSSSYFAFGPGRLSRPAGVTVPSMSALRLGQRASLDGASYTRFQLDTGIQTLKKTWVQWFCYMLDGMRNQGMIFGTRKSTIDA